MINFCPSSINLIEYPLPEKGDVLSWASLFFVACLFINVYFGSIKPRFLLFMADGLLHQKERHSIFFETINHEFRDKFLLLFQTFILLSLTIYTYIARNFSGFTVGNFFTITGIVFLSLCIFYFYKYITYKIIGWTFFDKEQLLQWSNSFPSLMGFIGIFIFIPTLILFYVDPTYQLCFYVIILVLSAGFITNLFTLYRIFFQKKNSFFYFILYLCGQEIIPLFLLYKGIVYVFSAKGYL